MTELGPFRLPYDHRMTFVSLINAGYYSYVSPKVTQLREVVESAKDRASLIAAKRGPTVRGGDPYRTADPQGDTGIDTIDVGMVNFWRELDPKAAPAFADLLGKRLARPEELLAFVATRPALPDGLWVLAIGDIDIIDGRLPALGLRVENGGKKYLLANRICRCAFRHSSVLLASP